MDEDHKERLDRELVELLNELRVILPGVQVLLAFLLTAPFNQRFPQLSGDQRLTFFAALLSTTVATACLIAPSTFHRLRFRAGDKPYLLRLSNWLVVVGTAFLALGICCALFVVTSFMYGALAAWIVGVLAALLIVWLWYGLAVSRAARGAGDPDPDPDPESEPAEEI